MNSRLINKNKNDCIVYKQNTMNPKTLIDFKLTKKESKLDKIVLKEIVDKKRLKRLLNSPYLKITDEKNDEEMLKCYSKKVKKNGLVDIKYSRKNGIARTYSNFKCYQGFRKLLRHTLSYDKYTDIDVVNAHPSMLLQITLQEGIVNNYLNKYVDNREHYLNRVIDVTKCDRSQAKDLFIMMMYGGGFSTWFEKHSLESIKLPSFCYSFKEEMNKISKIICNSNAEFIKLVPKDKRTKNNSILSYYLQEHEHRVLEVVYDYVKENKYIKNNICTLCYDGLMFSKINEEQVTNLCSELNKIVLEKTGFNLSFVEKVMNEVQYDIVDDANDDNHIDIEETEIMQMYQYILKISEENKYKKDNMRILKPSGFSPIVYEPYLDFQDFINSIFTKSSAYYKMFRKLSGNSKQLLEYLEKVDDEELPFIKLNKHIISFKNGYLNISNLNNITFNDFSNISNNIITSIHHDINFDQNILNMDIDDIETPLFDTICNYHLEDKELLKIMYGMCGRLHYNTNKYDRFNCMLFIKGGANTGKSTIGNILMKNHQNIGTISGKMEKTFGLQSLYKRNIVYNPDMGRNFTELLDKGDFQRIIEGSTLDIPIKNKGSLNNVKWNIPLLFLANYFPEYRDSSGAIPRRLCVFYMDKYLTSRDTSIETRCINNESHLILIKTLKSYQYIINKFNNKTFEDWDNDYFKRGYEEMTNKCNKLYEFLTLPPKEFEYWTVHKEGSVTELKDFKNAVKKFYYMNNYKDKFELDNTTLGRCGYLVKKINLCACCGKKPTGSRTIEGQCCKDYTSKNRRKKMCILNMRIENEIDHRINEMRNYL